MTVPVYTSPGRGGFGPQLSLSYDSGSGNGVFGLGWNLSLPEIVRKTDKGLPTYEDGRDTDVFILSGAEDLVPVLRREGDDRRPDDSVRIVHGQRYRVQRYRPRIEGLFARIERWTHLAAGDTHWRSTSRDNVTTLFGLDAGSRITDPRDPTKVFGWLISRTYDDKGNLSLYEYRSEDSAGIVRAQAHERNRTEEGRAASRYLKRIRYGNRLPFFPDYEAQEPPPLPSAWMFDIVFDYGEHDHDAPTPDDHHDNVWRVRPDPFSMHRAGFEVRTYRRCQRILMFHHFDEDPQVGRDCLVRSTDLRFADEEPDAPPDDRFSLLRAISQSGYVRTQGGYLRRQLPPLTFAYSEAQPREEVQELDHESQANLPVGLDGASYQWADLDGEGLSGILTEVAGAWLYKRNISASNVVVVGGEARTEARFGASEVLAERPTMTLAGAQLLDLAGDGQLDLVSLGGPTPGFFERTTDGGWESFTPLSTLPVLDWRDPNLKFVDLTGDGHADVLVTENEVFCWYPSRGEEGFGPASRVPQALDEEEGPRVVFADGTHSIFLADMCGDGLADLVRVCNGEVCYWPNLGYGRFGTKVTMDGSPWFDHPDQFDPRRLRLTDLDGSGPTDLVYLGDDGVQLYFNRSGNAWTAPRIVRAFPRTHQLASVSVVDLLGNGTSCLVWSSPLPGDAGRALHYVQLIGETKPHLLVRARNNLGAETLITYAPSTKFYLEDREAGRPWITRLPFPVHCVEKVTVTDKWRGTSFSTTYSYHHGYFDGEEREFRGFARVEQVDVESYGTFLEGNIHSPYITDDHTLYQPPVKTITWFHTGACLDRERILFQLADEYFPHGLEATSDLGDFEEHALPEPDLGGESLSVDDWREALRACKSLMLRQEVYELAVEESPRQPHRPVKLFSTAFHNCRIQRLQERGPNRHSVFLVTESEALTYNYELGLEGEAVAPDPRVVHTLNLSVDEVGNVLQSIAVAYPRRGVFADDAILPAEQALIQGIQRELHVVYTEQRFTADVDDADALRLRLPCETLTYDLTGVRPPREGVPFSLDELRRYRLGPAQRHPGELEVGGLPYQARGDGRRAEKRLVEHVRTLYLADNLTEPRSLGEHGRLGLPFESYKLALTVELAGLVLGDRFTSEVQDVLGDAAVSGYLSGPSLENRFRGLDTGEQYWIQSGVVGFRDPSTSAQNFYAPDLYTDPFGQQALVEYDPTGLLVRLTRDPKGNETRVVRFDYRTIAPREVMDLNGNVSEVIYDALGVPMAMALEGKGEGDQLTGLGEGLVNPTPSLGSVIAFFAGPTYDERQAGEWLQRATARYVYDLGEIVDGRGQVVWGGRPTGACAVLRETHAAGASLQAVFEYADGTGSVLVKKVQAEPAEKGGPLRWIASGRTVLNNKGKPVKQYEPYFTDRGHRFEIPEAVGVTPILYYDAVGRETRIEAPDGSYSRVTFSAWEAKAYDPNDTVAEEHNSWFERNTSGAPEERRAARLARAHRDTPTRTVLDSLGREVVSIAHNRGPDESGTTRDQLYVTFTRLDIEGKPLWIRDARQNLVMQYVVPSLPDHMPSEPPGGFAPAYDIAGNLLFQRSMDAGDRWTLNDAAGSSLFAWDVNDHYVAGQPTREERRFRYHYDELHRPLTQELELNGAPAQVIERIGYGEGQDDDRRHNLRGQPHKHHDCGGLVTNASFDFKGNLLQVHRQMVLDHTLEVQPWPDGDSDAGLDHEVFTKITEYDALNRMTRLYNWHSTSDRVTVYEPHYNRRGLLESEDIVMRARLVDGGYVGGTRTPAVSGVTYNAKGQRACLVQGNGTTTRYDYDPVTFRLRQLRTTDRGYDPPLRREVSELNRDLVLQLLRYTYDPSGNIVEVYDDAYEPRFFRNQRVEPSSQYTYDALYRLIRSSGREDMRWFDTPIGQVSREVHEVRFPVTEQTLRNYTQVYLYDEVGNIRQMKHTSDGERWRRNYRYAEGSNRLLRTWMGAAEDAAVRYEYDIHGSMLNLANVARSQWMTWDHKDMIHTLDRVGGGRAWYNYDGSKQRTRKRLELLDGTVEDRLYLGGMEVFRKTQGGQTTEKIETHPLFVDNQRVLLVDDVVPDEGAASDETLFRYEYGNHLGSAVLELDAGAATISYEEFHPYGTTAYEARGSGVPAKVKRYRYTGMERDEESGLSHHSARSHAAWLGRWISADPIGIVGGRNLYEYCFGNPCRYLDPSGTQPFHERLADTRIALRVEQREAAAAMAELAAERAAIRAALDQLPPGPTTHYERLSLRGEIARVQGEFRQQMGRLDSLRAQAQQEIRAAQAELGRLARTAIGPRDADPSPAIQREIRQLMDDWSIDPDTGSPGGGGRGGGGGGGATGGTGDAGGSGRRSPRAGGTGSGSGSGAARVAETPPPATPATPTAPGPGPGGQRVAVPRPTVGGRVSAALTRVGNLLGGALNIIGAFGLVSQAVDLSRFMSGESATLNLGPGMDFASDPNVVPVGTQVYDFERPDRTGTVQAVPNGTHYVLWDDGA